MAIVQVLLTAVTRSAGKILNTAFGWATMMLFGKVPQERQSYLSVLSFGSVAWIAAVVGIVVPRFGVFLLSFVRLPDWVQPGWVRLGMLTAALFIPLVIGFISIKLLDPAAQPKTTGAKARAILRGYPATLGLAVTLILVFCFVPFMRLPTMLKRWTTQHVPVIVEPTDYLDVVDEMEQVLQAAEWKVTRHEASWMLKLPVKILGTLAGGMTKSLVADQLTTLAASSLEVTLHPADLVIAGKEHEVIRARAALAEQLAFSKAYLTWSKEANELEDRIRRLWEEMRQAPEAFLHSGAIKRLQAIETDLKHVEIPYEEWEVLFRATLLVERSLLEVAAGVEDRPKDLRDMPQGERGAARLAERARPFGLPGKLIAAAKVAALAVLAWFGLRTATGREIIGPGNLVTISRLALKSDNVDAPGPEQERRAA
ncbi:MAG: hypothetical protein QOF51_3907 [Chloroflexota bacterium]|jgi:hypothetical protein|nr:hypothetical protein [Chloroflexota bacterium]